ncbi:MAG: methyltransferase domain-containing protein [Anaerolineae bacterium]|nr:methyltransferase domain-containing protein [Anaerolineae bacterium]
MLDIGCGAGMNIEHLRYHSYSRVASIDVSNRTLRFSIWRVALMHCSKIVVVFGVRWNISGLVVPPQLFRWTAKEYH